MTKQKANAIYDILVQECGAPEDERDRFVQQQCAEEIREWRFCGKLGFGGKFWRSGLNRLWVTCYSEDRTEERDRMIAAANKRLGEL